MRKRTLTVVAAIAIAIATLAPSPVARTQTAPRFEYLRVEPYVTVTDTIERGIPTRFHKFAGYRGCLAGNADWLCRQFEHTSASASDSGLRTALATLGNEGWELVSAVKEDHGPHVDGALTYLFKRQRQ
jgi:hypothetical protein